MELEWLESLPPLITIETANKSWQVWLMLKENVDLPAPSAATGPDGIMFYSWDKGEHHFEVEIFPDDSTEFFYRNRMTGEICGDTKLTDQLLRKLNFFSINGV